MVLQGSGSHSSCLTTTLGRRARPNFGPASTSAHQISLNLEPFTAGNQLDQPKLHLTVCATSSQPVPRNKTLRWFFGQRWRKSLCIGRPLSFWTCDCLGGQWLVCALLHSVHPFHIRLSASAPYSLTHCRNRSEFSFPQKKLSVLCQLSIWTYALMEGR